MERLQKVLARAGISSRRGAERLIDQGRVTVNGEVVRRQGLRVDPGEDAIKVDGRIVVVRPRSPTYVMLNKPRGYVTTLSDPEGRPTVAQLVRGLRTRLFPVGRLDYGTEGLLLLTDDGELAEALLHPRHGVRRTYLVKVRGRPDATAARRLRAGGIPIEGRPSGAARLRVVQPGSNSWVELTVAEGRKHHVRRLLKAVGHPVLKLRRIRYGGLALGGLQTGAWRRLTPAEVRTLRRVAGGGPTRSAEHGEST